MGERWPTWINSGSFYALDDHVQIKLYICLMKEMSNKE